MSLTSMKTNDDKLLRKQMNSEGYVERGTYIYKRGELSIELEKLLENEEDTIIFPHKSSKASDYKTRFWQFLQRNGSWRYRDGDCFGAHHRKELRRPEDPICRKVLDLDIWKKHPHKVKIFQKISNAYKYESREINDTINDTVPFDM